MRPLVVALSSVLAAGLVSIAHGQQSTFKGSTRTVAVYASVSDATGRLVPDLTRDDFSVLDNAKPQPLTVFANDIQPITVVLLLDRSGSMYSNFELVEKAAEQFVGDLQPADKARIGSFSNRIQIDPRDFTSNHEEMLSILRSELQDEGPTPLWNAINVGITALLHQDGRRVILVFTDGQDAPLNRNASTNSTLKDVMKRAEQEDIMVYAIGLASHEGTGHGGFRAGSGGGGRFGGGGGRGGGGRGGYGRRGGGGGGGGGGQPDRPDDGLPKIAAETGGGYFELTTANDLAKTFARVADELHHQYVLGFAPPELDGRSHKLDVTVKGEGRLVRARKSYLASAER